MVRPSAAGPGELALLAPTADARKAITFWALEASMRLAPMPGVGKWFAGEPMAACCRVA
jgi:hypothetical protein